MLAIGIVGKIDFERIWRELSPFVQAALQTSNGELELEDLKERVLAEKAQLWAVYDAGEQKMLGAATTELIDYPRKTAVRIITLGGNNASAWQSLLCVRIESWAKRYNADFLEAYGRPGFARTLERLGFVPTYIAFTKDLNNQPARVPSPAFSAAKELLQ